MQHHVPRQSVDSYTLANDEFGYAVYGFVLMADQEQQEKVQATRDAVRNRRSMLPAHVTLKGPVCDIPSVEVIQRVTAEIASSTEPLKVDFAGKPHARTTANGEVLAIQGIEVSKQLADLHEQLLKNLDPISTTAYPLDMTGEYRPHLTIYHEPLPEFEACGEELLKKLDIGDSFEARELHLVGHVGTPFRGEWKPISTHVFGGSTGHKN